jgi:hypothetical protein
MKKIILSTMAIATMVSANGDASTLNSESTEVKQEAKSSFLNKIHAKGDLRLRHEEIGRDDKTNKYRERYRFRYNLNVDVAENILFESAISSGKGNPTSGNVSFKDDQSIKDYFLEALKIDILDIAYKFDNSWVRAGKSKHHMYRPIKTQLIWDNDIRFEGVNYGYKDDAKNYRFGINRVHRLENHADSKDDIYMVVAQYVETKKLEKFKLNLGGGFYYYDGVKGNTTPYGKGALGNSMDENGLYKNDYAILEGFSELKFKEVMGKPFKVAGTFAYNTAVSSDNFAYDLSMQLGDTKKINDWKVGYTYRDIQKDSVFGAHNDSDFIAGGTDAKGNIITAKYKMAKNLDIGGHFQWSTLNASKAKTGVESDYHRIQLDAILKF